VNGGGAVWKAKAQKFFGFKVRVQEPACPTKLLSPQEGERSESGERSAHDPAFFPLLSPFFRHSWGKEVFAYYQVKYYILSLSLSSFSFFPLPVHLTRNLPL
jgi:hypothetical protein